MSQSNANTVACRDEALPQDWCLNPVCPSGLPRYNEGYKIPKWSDEDAITIGPVQTSFDSQDRERGLPPGWKDHVDFEGFRYFHNEEENAVTGSYLYDPEQAGQIQGFLQLTHRLRNELPTKFDSRQAQLVLWLFRQKPRNDEDTGWRCWYYYVDKLTRSIFWLEEHNFSYQLGAVKGGDTGHHIRRKMESEYWLHFQYFHNVHKVDMEIVEQMLGVIDHEILDTPISRSMEELTAVKKCANSCKKNLVNGGDGHPWIVGRILQRIAHDRYQNFYGQRGVRLSSMQSVHKDVQQEAAQDPLVYKVLSPLLFLRQSEFQRAFNYLMIDDILVHKHWENLVKGFKIEWTEHVTFATILLAANVSFLDVPKVVQDKISFSQLASCCSTIFSFATVVCGLVLLQKHKKVDHPLPMREVYKYLNSNHHSKWGFRLLAISYSLPFVFLLWGWIFFIVGFLQLCLTFPDSRAQWVVAIIFCIILVALLWISSILWNWSLVASLSDLKKLWKTAFVVIRHYSRPETIYSAFIGAMAAPRRYWEATFYTVLQRRTPEAGRTLEGDLIV